ncbi:hypothetical protein [Methanosphaera sp.]|uniref:hypothetical protein n=1 Tax=Methanosphaera sp. TaxID=2666342 RepID=UPI0025D9722A|nr:hypothetical protein [Methanosphaera sp.]
MAKKITLEEYKKSREVNVEEKPKKEKNPLLLPLEIFIVLFGLSLIVIVLLVLNNSKTIKDKNKKIADLKSQVSYQKGMHNYYKYELNSITGGKTSNYIRNKLNLIDNNIVFVIEGYGNYYYTYDCMLEKVGDRSYSYWAYNKPTAQSKGYWDGGC